VAMVARSSQSGKKDGTKRLAWRRLVLPGLTATLVPLLICLPPRWPAGDGRVRTLPADIGYKAAADRLAAVGLLRVRTIARPQGPPVEQIVLAGDLLRQNPALLGDCRTRWERWSFSPFHVDQPSRDCAARLDTYMREWTYLAEDMRQPTQWELDGDRVTALKSNARVLVPAGDTRASWRGRIRYYDQDVHIANAVRATLMFAEVGSHAGLFRFVEGWPAQSVTLDRLLSGEMGSEGGAFGISLATPGTTESIFAPQRISLQRLGRAVLVGLPPDLHGARVFVDGRPWRVEAGQFDNVRYLLIRPGQYLTFVSRAGHGRTMQLVETPGSISEFSAGRRIREPSLDHEAQQLEMSGVGGDVVSAIRGGLQIDLQRRLAVSMAAGSGAGDQRVSHRGAAILMDGLTGEIAAAASYPTNRAQLAEPDRALATRIAWLSLNYNFEPLPVGSAAKVPFAAAIVQAHPDLLAMRIRARAVFSSLDDQRLRLPDGTPRLLANNLGASSAHGIVDFNAFIADSNNEYALTLMRRATRAESGTHWMSTSSWAANLWRFACVIPFGLVPRDRDLGWRSVSDNCSPYLWRSEEGDALGSDPIAGAWLNLRMGAIGDDYKDFYLDILGGGRSTWTTANLAQAYARILSGRAISPNLAWTGRPAHRDSVVIAPATWTALSRGMADVIRIGTARSLWSGVLGRPGAVPAGVYFYAKTGTSTLSSPARGNGHLLVLMVARTRTGRPPRRPNEICALKILTINLQRDSSSALELAARLLDPAGGRQYLEWMTEPCPNDPAY
jgi:hypothetical protein